MSCEKRKDGYAPCLAGDGVPDSQTGAAYFAGFERPDFAGPPKKSIWKRLLYGMGQGLMYALVFQGGLGESVAYAIGYGTTEFIHKGRKPVPAWQAEPGDYIETADKSRWLLTHVTEDADGRYLRVSNKKTGDTKYLQMQGKKAVAQLSPDDFISKWGRNNLPKPVRPPANRPLPAASGKMQPGQSFVLPASIGEKHAGRKAFVLENRNGVLKVLSEHPDQTNVGHAVLYMNEQGNRVNPDGSPYTPPQDRQGDTNFANVNPGDKVTIPSDNTFGNVKGATGTVLYRNENGVAAVRVTHNDASISMRYINGSGQRVTQDGAAFQPPALPKTRPLQSPPGPRGDGTIITNPVSVQAAVVDDMVMVDGEMGLIEAIDENGFHIYFPGTDSRKVVDVPPQISLPDQVKTNSANSAVQMFANQLR